MEKKDKYSNTRIKSQELLVIYENIITLFKENPPGLTTKETYELLIEQFGFDNHLRSVENYLKDLEAGMVPGIRFKWVKRRKHMLDDFRETSAEDIQKHLEKLESKEVVHGEERAYMRLAMEAIRELDSLSSKHHKEIERRLGISGMESPYFIDNEDMEFVDMSDPDIIDLKDAIKKDAVIEFRYTGKSRKDWYVAEPYKLIIFDGLWYLFGKDRDDPKTPFKTWRLIYIKDVDYARDGSMKHTMPDEHAEHILKRAERARFVVDVSGERPVIKNDTLVKVKVAAEFVEDFDHEAHIPGEVSEPITNSDGSLTVTTKVNSILDVDNAIKSLIPHIEILEPLEYRKKFLMELEMYRDKFKDELETLTNIKSDKLHNI